MNFIVESSSVPIYNRIAKAFAQTLIELGHIVHFIDTSEFNENDFIKIINNIKIDYYLSTNELNFIQKEFSSKNNFIFEKIYKNIIFIHHDNIFSSFNDINFISRKLKAFQNIKSTSYHFCLENSNVQFLKFFGILNAFKITHASEFKKASNINSIKWGVTFIGHLMSSFNLYPSDSLVGGGQLQVLAWNRFSKSSYAIQPSVHNLLNDKYFINSLGNDYSINNLLTQQFLISELNKLSSPLRGQLISTIKNHRVDIFGGDLSYGLIKNPLLILKQDNIFYNKHTNDYMNASQIYQNSRINLNISSLQFDTAVNNRVIDIASSGGFVLTDKRSDLYDFIPFHSEISFETPEEMNDKINYWMNSSSNYRYLEIKNELTSIFNETFSYKNTLSYIIKFLN